MWLNIFLLSQITNFPLTTALNTISQPRTRVTPFKPKITEKICLLKPDPGPCRADIAMFHFKPDTMECTRFSWGGCQGNGNRFDSKRECLDTCITRQKIHYRPKWCFLTFDYGFCFGAIKRWYYDVKWKVCKETIYSGCGGNKNNFYNLAQCDSICRFGKGPIQERTIIYGNPKKVLIINPLNATTSDHIKP